MIKCDKYGIVCQHDPYNLNYMDGGDSARVMGLLALSTGIYDQAVIGSFVKPEGLGVRHPYQSINNNNNPNNFTRDQLLCLMAGLSTDPKAELNKELFYSHAKRKFRCQNTHDQDNNLKPWYRGPDLLHPGHIGFMIQAAKLYWLYPLLIFCWPFTLIELLFSLYIKPDRESNQIIAMLWISGSGWLKLYCKLHPNWKLPILNYWGGFPFRDQKEIADILINAIEKKLKV